MHVYVSFVLTNLLQTQQAAADTAQLMKTLLKDQQQMQKEQNAVGAELRICVQYVDLLIFLCFISLSCTITL